MMSFLRGNNWCKCCKGEMNAREAASNLANLLDTERATLLTEQGWSGTRSDQHSENRRSEGML